MKFTLKYYLTQKFKNYPEYLIVYFLAYLFFLLSLTENFSAAHDSITYLNDIEGKENLFHPHHLLYNAFASVWLNLWKFIFPGTAAHYIIEAFTAIWVAGILLISWCFLRNRLGLKVLPSFISLAIIAFSYGVWFYGANIEVYAPSVFFMLWVVYELSNDKPETSYGNINIIHCLAILFHQVNIIFSIILLWKFRKNRKWVLNYILTGIVLVGGVYCYAGWVMEGKNNLNDFSRWVLGYTYGHGYWAPWNVGTILAMFTGFGHAIIGGQFIFNSGGLGKLLKEKFSGHNFEDEIFLVKDLSQQYATVLLVLSCLAGICILIFIIKFINLKPWKSADRKFFTVLASAFLLYTFFFSFWEPEILEFWILQSVIFWLVIIGYVLKSSSYKLMLSLAVFLAVSLFIINYLGSMKWLKDKEYDLYHVRIAELKPVVQKGDLFILDKPWISDEYISRFLGNRVYASDALSEIPFENFNGRIIYLPGSENTEFKPDIDLYLTEQQILRLSGGQRAIIYSVNAE